MPAYQPEGVDTGPAINRRQLLGGAAAGAMALAMPKRQSIEYAKDGDKGYWTLEKCKRCYMDYLGSKNEEIAEQKNARQYRHGAQWTPGQVETFNLRRQPVVTYNRIGRKIDSIVGLMEKLKQDPKAYPRTDKESDAMGAELATACVRYIIDADLRESRFPFAIENAAMDGIGGVEMMLIKGDKGDTDIGFALVKTDSFFYDPRCFDHDYADARYMGSGKWLEMEDAKALAPTEEIADQIENSSQSGSELTSSPDREQRWFDTDPTHKRVRVVDLWYKCEGEWRWCLFTGSLKIDEGKGYFYNERNEMICKYIMFSGFVDHDGDRYGFPRGLRSSQDEINQRRSKGLHELNSRRIKAEDGAFTDIEVTRREATRPDGVVIYNKGFEMEFDDQARIANVEGQLKFLEDAKNEIENFGPNPALIGQGLEYKSGRAINLLQQAGIAELGPFVINVKNWKLRLYRAIWCAVQRYWTAERYIRVTDDAGIAQMVQVNGVGLDEMGYPKLVNAIGNLDVNFVLDEGPDEINMMGDAYDTLVALTAQGANIPPQVLLELAPLQASLKRKLLTLVSQKDPVAEQAKQITLAGETAKVDETKSKTALNIASAQEKQQGGAHGLIERQMDSAMAQDEHRMKREEHGMKMQETMVKAAATAEQGRAKVAGEFDKLQTQRVKGQQEMQFGAAKHEMGMQQQRDKHVIALRAAEQKANGKAPRQLAEGGPFSENETVIVGEKGPETVKFSRPGVVIPNAPSEPTNRLGRERYDAELQNQRVRDRLIAYMKAETGGQGPEASQAVAETFANRGIARQQPLSRVLSGSYFPSSTHSAASRPVTDADRAKFGPIIDKVMAGSNITNYATGNASGTVGFAGGPQTFASGGERFGIEGPDKGWWNRIGASGPGAMGSVPYTGGSAAPGSQGTVTSLDQLQPKAATPPAAASKGPMFNDPLGMMILSGKY